MESEVKEEVSLFGYYVRAANVAARLGIGLGYAFDKYVKPTMPKGVDLKVYTSEEWAAIYGAGEESVV